jgi:hypothetical protein
MSRPEIIRAETQEQTKQLVGKVFKIASSNSYKSKCGNYIHIKLNHLEVYSRGQMFLDMCEDTTIEGAIARKIGGWMLTNDVLKCIKTGKLVEVLEY